MYDAIVVGLGPAGATAACELSRKGLNVLAIEKASMPRYKACGGALSAKIEKILDVDFKSVVERTVHGICLSYRGGEAIHSRSELPISYLVMRDRFDHHLAEKAELEGVTCIRERVLHVKEQDTEVVVTTDKGHHCAPIVIGADGGGSAVARSLGLRSRGILSYLVEGEVRVKQSMLEHMADEIRFDVGTVPHGYGWIFPKADHLSVGAGSIGRPHKNPLRYYSTFLTSCLPDLTESCMMRRCALPLYQGRTTIATTRSLLVGDAAALADPFLGEGIYYAVKSAQIASEVIAEGYDAAIYEKHIAEEISSELKYAKKVGALIYRFPGPVFKLLQQHPEFIRRFLELSRGEISYQELWGRFKKRLMKEPLVFLGAAVHGEPKPI